MWHRHKHLLTRWGSRGRRVEEVLAQARRHDEAEARAARARLLSQATMVLPAITSQAAPLLTRGQAERSQTVDR